MGGGLNGEGVAGGGGKKGRAGRGGQGRGREGGSRELGGFMYLKIQGCISGHTLTVLDPQSSFLKFILTISS